MHTLMSSPTTSKILSTILSCETWEQLENALRWAHTIHTNTVQHSVPSESHISDWSVILFALGEKQKSIREHVAWRRFTEGLKESLCAP